MEAYEVLQRELNLAVEGVNSAVLALQRALPPLGVVGQAQRQEAERLATTLCDIEDDLVTLLDIVEEQADQAGQADTDKSDT